MPGAAQILKIQCSRSISTIQPSACSEILKLVVPSRRPSGMVRHRFRPVNFSGLENRMTAQPPPPPGYPPQPPASQAPKNYLVWSILVTLFCCLIPGIVAIVFSAQVNGLWAQGRYAEAQKASARARTWVIISVVLGLISVPISIYYATKSGDHSNAAMLAGMF